MINEHYNDLETQKSVAWWMLSKQMALLCSNDEARPLVASIDRCIATIVDCCDKQVGLITDELNKKKEHAKAIEKLILEKVRGGTISEAALNEIGIKQ